MNGTGAGRATHVDIGEGGHAFTTNEHGWVGRSDTRTIRRGRSKPSAAAEAAGHMDGCPIGLRLVRSDHTNVDRAERRVGRHHLADRPGQRDLVVKTDLIVIVREAYGSERVDPRREIRAHDGPARTPDDAVAATRASGTSTAPPRAARNEASGGTAKHTRSAVCSTRPTRQCPGTPSALSGASTPLWACRTDGAFRTRRARGHDQERCK